MVTRTSRLENPVSFPKDESEWHSFLDGNVKVALEIRDHVESLPETRAFFSLSELDRKLSHVPEGCVKLTGAWKAPKLLLDGNSQKWVNPNYIHAQHYSDAVVRCGCGIPVLRLSFGPNEKQPSHHQEHNEGCTRINRKECELQLLKNRRDIIKDAYEHGHTSSGVMHRLGYGNNETIGGHEATQLGLDLTELGQRSRQKVARTAMVLCREYSTVDVARLFGLSRNSIVRMLREESVTSPKKLYSVRRKTA